jgi:hypothetical protein
METRGSASAFQWIVRILETRAIPFAISGGLAAKSYGSLRELNDIDIDIPDDSFCKIVPEVAPHTSSLAPSGTRILNLICCS